MEQTKSSTGCPGMPSIFRALIRSLAVQPQKQTYENNPIAQHPSSILCSDRNKIVPMYSPPNIIRYRQVLFDFSGDWLLSLAATLERIIGAMMTACMKRPNSLVDLPNFNL